MDYLNRFAYLTHQNKKSNFTASSSDFNPNLYPRTYAHSKISLGFGVIILLLSVLMGCIMFAAEPIFSRRILLFYGSMAATLLYSLYYIANKVRSKIILLPDTVIIQSLFKQQSLHRDNIKGFRLASYGNWLRVYPKCDSEIDNADKAQDLQFSKMGLVLDQAFYDWFTGLTDFTDATDYDEDEDEDEADTFSESSTQSSSKAFNPDLYPRTYTYPIRSILFACLITLPITIFMLGIFIYPFDTLPIPLRNTIMLIAILYGVATIFNKARQKITLFSDHIVIRHCFKQQLILRSAIKNYHIAGNWLYLQLNIIDSNNTNPVKLAIAGLAQDSAFFDWFSEFPHFLSSTTHSESQKFNPDLYPKTYSHSIKTIGWEIFIILCSLFMIGTLQDTEKNISFGLWIVIGIFVLVALYALYHIVHKIRVKIILLPDEMIVQSIFKRQSIHRDSIKAFSTDYQPLLSIYLYTTQIETNNDPQYSPSIKLTTMGLEGVEDAIFAWLNGINNLTNDILLRTIQKIEQDARLGNTIVERNNNLDRAEYFAGYTIFPALLLGIGCIGLPFMYAGTTLIITIAALLPCLAILICARYPLYFDFSFDGDNIPRSQTSLIALLIIPTLSLMITARTTSWLSTQSVILPAFIIGTLFVCLIGCFLRKKTFNTILTALILLTLYAGSTLLIFNQKLDSKPATYFPATLTKKNCVCQTGITRITVSPWSPHSDNNSLEIDCALHNQLEVGQPLCIKVHPGRFGFPWVSSVHEGLSCGLSVSSSPPSNNLSCRQ